MTEWDRRYMNARRFPRSMTEAFGPHTDDTLHPMPDQRKTPAHEVVLYVVAVLAIAAILIFQP